METQIMKRIIVAFVFMLLLVGCSDHGTEPINDNEHGKSQDIYIAVPYSTDNLFGFKLFSLINENETEKNKNVIISPFSISMALGMALNGADGATLDSMKKVLERSNLTLQNINESYRISFSLLTQLDPDVVLQIANSIWCEKNFTVYETFLHDCKNYFNAEVASLDFSSPDAVQVINNWVSSKTNGKIEQILQRIPGDAVMYLINALYFKGVWTYQFDPSYTKEFNFITSQGNIVPCNMMSQKAVFAYKETDEAQIIDLPYGNRSFSMTIILPKEGIDIDQYAVNLSDSKWVELVNGLDSTEVNLSIPKFKLEYEKSLIQELSAMGMSMAFDSDANFSRISSVSTYISEVRHKTFIETNEEGTEAAAVTVIEFVRTLTQNNTVMLINHPFIFAIREHTSGSILLMGKIVAPTKD